MTKAIAKPAPASDHRHLPALRQALRAVERPQVKHEEILWESETVSDAEVRAKETELIRVHCSNDPAVGYNRWPKP